MDTLVFWAPWVGLLLIFLVPLSIWAWRSTIPAVRLNHAQRRAIQIPRRIEIAARQLADDVINDSKAGVLNSSRQDQAISLIQLLRDSEEARQIQRGNQ